MKQLPLILFGMGGVGRALVRQIVASRATLAQRNGLQLAIVAVADSRHWLFNPTGFSDEALLALEAAKSAGQPLAADAPPLPAPAELVHAVHAGGVGRAVLVDVTAVGGMEPALNAALAAGDGVVLANKKALAGPWATAAPYFANPAVRHESTVGGGQPVIATLRYLMDIQDVPHEISGQLSGTLGFLCQQLDDGRPFADILAEAKARGYTEPDPREDLSGQDVQRKVLILARMAGWPLEASDIDVEPLYPTEMASLTVPEFMTAASQLNANLAERVAQARATGHVLRYVAQVTAAGGKVGLTAVPQHSPTANLKYISFRTGLYDDDPLLICGKGAGVEMTAGGVLGDLIGLGREL
jgi:homoserine dehydrogenase